MTTDPEAEVLIGDTIDIKYITDICFSSRLEQQKYDRQVKNMNLTIDTHFYTDFFYPRDDFRYWQ